MSVLPWIPSVKGRIHPVGASLSKCCLSAQIIQATAVPQLLHPETTALKWHFPQENATLLNAGKGT
jgi:hypothetical protein